MVTLSKEDKKKKGKTSTPRISSKQNKRLTKGKRSLFHCLLVTCIILASGGSTSIVIKKVFKLIDNNQRAKEYMTQVTMDKIRKIEMSEFFNSSLNFILLKKATEGFSPSQDSAISHFADSLMIKLEKVSDISMLADSTYEEARHLQNIYYSTAKTSLWFAFLTLVVLILAFASVYAIYPWGPKKRPQNYVHIIVESLEISLAHSIGFSRKSLGDNPLPIRILFVWERLLSAVYILIIVGVLIGSLA